MLIGTNDDDADSYASDKCYLDDDDNITMMRQHHLLLNDGGEGNVSDLHHQDG